jgi:hypothetical protein
MTWENGAERAQIYSELVMRMRAILCHTWTKLGGIGACLSSVVGSDTVEGSVSYLIRRWPTSVGMEQRRSRFQLSERAGVPVGAVVRETAQFYDEARARTWDQMGHCDRPVRLT